MAHPFEMPGRYDDWKLSEPERYDDHDDGWSELRQLLHDGSDADRELCDDEPDEPTPLYGPEEDDITTTNHREFYQSGKLLLRLNEAEAADDRMIWFRLDQAMRESNFFPNVWFVSDHGNAHLMERPTDPPTVVDDGDIPF